MLFRREIRRQEEGSVGFLVGLMVIMTTGTFSLSGKVMKAENLIDNEHEMHNGFMGGGRQLFKL